MNLSSKNKVSAEFSMASMTDIVFLLLIFFMLTSNVVSESNLDVTLPKSEGKANEGESTILEISKDGRFAINGEIISKDSIEYGLKNKFINIQNPSFVIKADENSLHKEVVFLMSIAQKNKYKVVLATSPTK